MSILHTLIRSCLERIAPLSLAEKWDKVGLLLEAPYPRPTANRILLTIDLTTAVVEEALASRTTFIVSYHPPIFNPLSSITLSNPLQASLLRCAANGISIYTPHTALDSVRGGINDWLAEGISGKRSDTYEVRYISHTPMELEGGQGRIVTFHEPISMSTLEDRIKAFLELEHIQVAYTPAKDLQTVQTVAICAGSGGSLLLGVSADVYFTGEMSHHEILAAVASGHNIVLCGHTNTERGYLPVLAQKLSQSLESLASDVDPALASSLRALEVSVSQADRHPLQFV
ncbi:NGG1p interacting factor 3 [Amylocystis lapponica]|nr:NGG1p interacting factor 3 [Amylocystis lapponica]